MNFQITFKKTCLKLKSKPKRRLHENYSIGLIVTLLGVIPVWIGLFYPDKTNKQETFPTKKQESIHNQVVNDTSQIEQVDTLKIKETSVKIDTLEKKVP